MNHMAVIFPGQGSQFLGMLSEEAAKFPEIISTFSRASDCLGYNLWDLVQNDSENKLDQTQYTQPALLVASFALWEVWRSQTGSTPDYLAGHSLGEYTALVCADALNFEDAVTLVAERGRLMQGAVNDTPSAMAAVIGLSDEEVAEICQVSAETQILSPANFNAVGQVVISGEEAAVERAIQRLLLLLK